MYVTASEIMVHKSDVIMSAMTSEITGVSIICLAVCSGADQRKHPRSASLAFVKGNPPFDDVFMRLRQLTVFMNLQTINEWNLKAPHSRPFVREIHGWAVDSPYKGPAIWKAFRWHDAIMGWRNYVFRMTHVVISFRLVLSCAIAPSMPTMVKFISPHRRVSNITTIVTIHNRVLFCSPYINSNTNLWYLFVALMLTWCHCNDMDYDAHI